MQSLEKIKKKKGEGKGGSEDLYRMRVHAWLSHLPGGATAAPGPDFQRGPWCPGLAAPAAQHST